MRKIIITTLAFIALAGSASAELYTAVQYPHGANILATLRVRAGPSSLQPQISEAQRGEKVVILQCQNAFCFAERQNGVSGWIHKNYFVNTGPVEKPAVTPQRPELSDRMIMRPIPNVKFGF